MTTYVLVHGAWFGGWMWRDVASRLRQQGHDVHAPSLTGFGDRRHLLSPAVDLDTHIADVVGLIETSDLHDVVLVGHSYSGMVVTAVGDRIAERLRHVHYLDAFVPTDGESVYAIVGGLRPEMVDAAVAGNDPRGWVASAAAVPDEQFGLDPETDTWAGQRFGDAPAAIMEGAVHLSGQPTAATDRSFLYCTDNPNGLFTAMAERARRQGWHVSELAAAHGAALTHPDQVTDVLLGLA